MKDALADCRGRKSATRQEPKIVERIVIAERIQTTKEEGLA